MILSMTGFNSSEMVSQFWNTDNMGKVVMLSIGKWSNLVQSIKNLIKFFTFLKNKKSEHFFYFMEQPDAVNEKLKRVSKGQQ